MLLQTDGDEDHQFFAQRGRRNLRAVARNDAGRFHALDAFVGSSGRFMYPFGQLLGSQTRVVLQRSKEL